MENNTTESLKCLGSTWSIGRNRGTDGVLALRLIGARADPYVVFRPSKSLYTEAWNLNIDVNLDLENCR